MIERAELDYELGIEIGLDGQNSRVFEAVDRQLNAEIVVKKIPRSAFKHEAEYFLEAQRLYDARHPNVVHVSFAGVVDDHVIIAMPRYRTSVQSVLRKRRLTVREIVRYGLDFLTGLHHVHIRKLVHFDVKASNILIDSSDRAALSDFGLARYVDVQGLAEQDMMYQMHRVPESLIATHMSSAADIYQAGVTLYRMATGYGTLEAQWNAYPDSTEVYKAVLAGKLPDRSAASFPAHIPSRLISITRKALMVDAADRYSTVLSMINDLAAVDEFLDWAYEIDAATGEERWTQLAGEYQKEVVLNPTSETSFEVLARTVRLSDGTKRVNRKLSDTAKTRASGAKLVRTALLTL
jgi:serine/threonine protein kinase